MIFVAAGARLRLRSVSGERVVPISEFFIDRGKTCLREDELLTEILMPRRGLENYYYKKIGARAAMAISRVSFVAIYGEADGRIERMSIAFGAVSGVVLRFLCMAPTIISLAFLSASSLALVSISLIS